MESILQINFTILLDLLGAFAFAVSGTRLASSKKMDWFGAYVIGLVAAIGGGILRDSPLGVTEVIAAAIVITRRLLAVKFHIHLPQLQQHISDISKDKAE